MQVFRLGLPSMAHLLKAGRSALLGISYPFQSARILDEGV